VLCFCISVPPSISPPPLISLQLDLLLHFCALDFLFDSDHTLSFRSVPETDKQPSKSSKQKESMLGQRLTKGTLLSRVPSSQCTEGAHVSGSSGDSISSHFQSFACTSLTIMIVARTQIQNVGRYVQIYSKMTLMGFEPARRNQESELGCA
jgi:hypothetical protein